VFIYVEHILVEKRKITSNIEETFSLMLRKLMSFLCRAAVEQINTALRTHTDILANLALPGFVCTSIAATRVAFWNHKHFVGGE